MHCTSPNPCTASTLPFIFFLFLPVFSLSTKTPSLVQTTCNATTYYDLMFGCDERERDETCCYFVIVVYILSSKQETMYTLFLHHVMQTHHQTQPSGRLQSVQFMHSLHQIIRNHNAMNPITQRRRTHRKKPILLTKSWCVSSRRGWITEAYFLMSCFRSS